MPEFTSIVLPPETRGPVKVPAKFPAAFVTVTVKPSAGVYVVPSMMTFTVTCAEVYVAGTVEGLGVVTVTRSPFSRGVVAVIVLAVLVACHVLPVNEIVPVWPTPAL